MASVTFIYMQSNLHSDSDALREFYSIALGKELAFVDQASEVLRHGCQYLALHCGIISYVEGERYTILHVHAASDEYKIQSGDVFELGLTYCKFTLEQKKPVGFHHAAKTDIAKHPSYEALKLESYLGAPIYLNDELFGTVNFTSINSRAEAFTENEMYFVQLIAEWISVELNRNYRQASSYHQLHKTFASRLETSPLAVIEMTPSFEVTKWNDAAELILGWRKEQVINKAPKDWPTVSQNDLGDLVSLLENLNQCGEKSCAFSYDLTRNNGQLISTEWLLSYVDSDVSNCSKVQVHILDVTDRVNAENELLRKSALYQDLFQNAPDMYMSLNESGVIISANSLCNKTLGYQSTELIGTPYWNLIEKNDVRRIRRLIEVAFLGNVEELEMEANILKKDDSVIRSHQRIRIIQAKKGMPRELRIIARDITEREREQVNQLEHLNQQRDEISLEVQHRIKNSLQAVIGMLSVGIDSHPELKPLLTTSIAQIHAISIVNGLIMDGKDDVDLLGLLASLIEASSKLFHHEIQFNHNSDSDMTQMLVADEVIPVSLVITELLTNALKYTAEISTKENYIRVNAISKEDGVNIEIINTCSNTHVPEDSGSNLGLSMIKALLPPSGVEFNVSMGEELYIASMNISDPVTAIENRSK